MIHGEHIARIANNQIKIKTLMLKSSLCDYGDAYILIKGNVIVKNCAPITDTKICLLVVTLPTQDNVKLIKQLKSGFKGKINWNKYQS